MLSTVVTAAGFALAQDPAAGASAPAPMTAERAAAVREAVIPSEPEVWESVGWRTDLLAARREAFEDRKAVFLWSMNGHPLGCV